VVYATFILMGVGLEAAEPYLLIVTLLNCMLWHRCFLDDI
jgi:hypothetical protein